MLLSTVDPRHATVAHLPTLDTVYIRSFIIVSIIMLSKA